MADEQNSTPIEPIEVGSFFLETLTTGMYEDPFHCIREYVQNGYDAISDAVRVGVIKQGTGSILITIGGTDRTKSMAIRDNGIGVPADKAYSTLVSLGASRKNPNLHAGFRGIGRLAGIAYCGTLRFKTKVKGEAAGTIVEYDCGKIRGYLKPGAEPKDVREVMRAAVSFRSFDEAVEDHYTEVEMTGMTNVGNEFADLDRLHPYLSQVCPVAYGDKFDWSDQINAMATSYGEAIGVVQVETRLKRERFPIHKPYKNEAAAGKRTATLHDIETFTSKEHGWYGWIGRSDFPGELTDETVAGVRFRVKNIQVGDSRIMMDLAEELTLGGSERRLPRWAVGEIFIANAEIVPNARRDGFEDTPAWRLARADIKEVVGKRIIKLIRSTSYSRSALKRAQVIVESVEAELAGASLTADQKKKFDGRLKRQIDKLSSDRIVGPDPKEISSLISTLKDLQERLAKIPISEPQRPSPSPQRPKPPQPGATPSTPGAESPGEEPPEQDVLDIVYEVLAEELGEEEAERLVDIIAGRIGG
jgi:hypothetical protein